FLRRVAGNAAVGRAMAVNTARIARQRRSTRSRDALKALVLRDLFAGYDAVAIDEIGRGFAFEIVQRHLRADMVQRADWHRTQGHELVIVSASLGVYLRPVAEQLRFDAVLCTELEVGPDGALTGEMAGTNVRGLEKARRLDRYLGGAPSYVWAYGDSSGDRELWARADHAVRVSRRGSSRVG
ncbi:MAG TPA: HAD-IB family hydrolase, partial [Acidimicrobiia bacterium]|nr:HAD-IB family hydrolase [Acidimicrobiia bacterium]